MKAFKLLLPVIVGALLLLVPTPQGLSPNAWQYFALFAAVVVALVLEPIPPALAGVIGVAVAVTARLVPLTAGGKLPNPSEAIRWGLSGFSDATVWLIFMAFMFALGYEKTGLGKRIALSLIKWMGKSTLGLGYAVAFADLCLAPFMPSNTARSGGTIFPIIKNIPPMYGSTPDNEPRKMGAYLMWVALATTCITSSMFLTGLAPNVLAQKIVADTVKVKLEWAPWTMSFLPVGILLFAITPILTYIIYPPSLKKSPEAPAWAAGELQKLGPITSREIIMAVLALGALLMWIFASDSVNATTVALLALAVMCLVGVVSWDDVVSYKGAWNVLAWFATLVTLADGLNKTGFLSWFGKLVGAELVGYTPMVMLVALLVVFYVSHYLFASVTAHVAALLPVFLVLAKDIPGLDIAQTAMLLCSTLGIMGIITPYGTGPSPIYFGSGYVKSKDFWVLGFIFGFIYLAAFLGIGLPWNMMRG